MRLTEILEAIKNYPSENQRRVKYTHVDLADEKNRDTIKEMRKKAKSLLKLTTYKEIVKEKLTC